MVQLHPQCSVRPTLERVEDVLEVVEVDCHDSSSYRRGKTPLRIQSSLPLENPAFREIARLFSNRLPVMLSEMRTQLASQNFAALWHIAHKLKGTGGTVGFHEFTDPCQKLIENIESGNVDRVEELIQQLEAIAVAIEVS